MITPLPHLQMQRMAEVLRQRRQFSWPERIQTKEILSTVTRNALQFFELKFAKNAPDQNDDPTSLAAKLKRHGLFEAHSYIASENNGMSPQDCLTLMGLIEETCNEFAQVDRHIKPLPPHHLQAQAREDAERRRQDVLARCDAVEKSMQALLERFVQREDQCTALEVGMEDLREQLSTLQLQFDKLASDLGNKPGAADTDKKEG